VEAGNRISVLVAEEHGVLRDGLLHILGHSSDIEVLVAVGDGEDAVRHAERLSPHVAVMGIAMPSLNGVDATRALAQKSPGTGVVLLSMHASSIVLRRALDAGARGFLTKASNAEEVLSAVRAVAAGRRYVGRGIAERLLEGGRPEQQGDRATEVLTTTERNILRLVAEGRTNPQVAAALGLSPRTVETYRLRLMRKLDIDSLAALVKFAIRNGVIAID